MVRFAHTVSPLFHDHDLRKHGFSGIFRQALDR